MKAETPLFVNKPSNLLNEFGGLGILFTLFATYKLGKRFISSIKNYFDTKKYKTA